MTSSTLFSRGLLCIFVALLAAGCGSGSGSGSSVEAVNSPAAPPPNVTQAPELASLSPTSMSFSLQANVSANGALVFDNTGDAPLIYDLATTATWIAIPTNDSGSVAAGGSVSITVTATCGSTDLSGTIVLTTNDADEASVTIPVTVTCASAANDFEIARVLMNQAARGFDSDLSSDPNIDILAGREMLVRAFVTGSGQSPDVRVVIERPGQADFVAPMNTPPSIASTPASETLLSASHYVVVAGSAIQENSSLRIEVAPFTGAVSYPSSGNIMLSPVDPGTFEITFVPVTFGGQTPSISATAYIREARQVLPIGALDVDVRAPYTFTGTYDLDDLLMEISDLRDLDGSDRFYHAVIIPPAGSASDSAGIGFVEYPVSVSIDLGGTAYVIAHELGHNLSLRHAPGCSAPNADPDFPYANGAVTTWGFDTVNDTLVEPTVTKSDFMSYCADIWVSDYQFDKALDYRGQSSGAAVSIAARSTAGGLSITGRVSNGEVSSVRMLPTDYVVERVDTESARYGYRFVAWDNNGLEVINQPFNTHEIADLGEADAFMLRVPQPVNAIDHYEVRQAGQPLHTASMAGGEVDPSAIELSWSNNATHVQWSPVIGDALVVRDMQGQVVAVDRSGSFELASATEFTLALAAGGEITAALSVSSGSEQRIELTR